MPATREGYSAIDAEDGRGHFEIDAGLLKAFRWPRKAGLLASMNAPSPSPSSAHEWWLFFTTTRGMPLTHNLVANMKAGATVACVNLALSISLAVASGGTPTQGMMCGMWSSAVVGLLGGSHFNVVGTTSALSGMMETLSIRYGSAVLPTVAIYASLFLAVFALLRVDRLMRFIATPVAHGFAVGVAAMIGFGQLSSAFAIRGLPKLDGFINKLLQFGTNIEHASPADGALYVASAAALFYLAKRWGRAPWVLILAGAGIALGMLASAIGGGGAAASGAHPMLFLLREKFPEISMGLRAPGTVLPTWLPLIGSAPGADHCTGSGHRQVCVAAGPQTWQYQPDVIFYSFGCAVVALLETLISAHIANRLLKGSAADFDLLCRTYSSLREGIALAIAAMTCGIAGGMCPAAALARTSLNIKSGAFSRVSGLLQTVMLGGVAFAVMPYFEYLPFAIVGSILLLVAYRLIDFDELATLRRGDPAGMYLCILTAVVCLCMDTFAGLIIGTAASIAMNLHALRTRIVETRVEAHRFVPDGVHTEVLVKAALTFANIGEAAGALEEVIVHAIDAGDRYVSVHLDLAACEELDFDAAEALDDWARKVRLTGAKLSVDCGIHLTRIMGVTHNLTLPPEDKTAPVVIADARSRNGSSLSR